MMNDRKEQIWGRKEKIKDIKVKKERERQI